MRKKSRAMSYLSMYLFIMWNLIKTVLHNKFKTNKINDNMIKTKEKWMNDLMKAKLKQRFSESVYLPVQVGPEK